MFSRSKINRLYRCQVRLTRAQLIMLLNSISSRELRLNVKLRAGIEKILHQMELIEELSHSFE